MTQEVPELPPSSPIPYATRIYNRLALRGHEEARSDCADIAGEADAEITALRTALTQAVADAQRWQFFDNHAQSTYKGRRLGEWLMFDAVMEHGSRNAALDEAMRQGAQHE